MNIAQMLTRFADMFRWWVTVVPWEKGIRVRLGKYQTVLEPGVHVRLPLIDRVFRQSIRRRFSLCPTQTVSTKDGKAVTLRGGLSYAIVDIALLHNSVHQAEDTIQTEAQAFVARYVRARNLEHCEPADLEDYVVDQIDLSRYGLGDVEFSLTDFVAVKTYRVIDGSPRDYMVDHDADLSTVNEDGFGKRR
jgi:hypothetical protein